jgi:hypothetical protein
MRQEHRPRFRRSLPRPKHPSPAVQDRAGATQPFARWGNSVRPFPARLPASRNERQRAPLSRSAIACEGSSTLTPRIFGLPVPFTVNATTSINWDLTTRARVGYAFDNVLAYATLGVALLGAKTDLTGVLGVNPCVTISVINGTPGLLTCRGTNKRLGGTIGAGII